MKRTWKLLIQGLGFHRPHKQVTILSARNKQSVIPAIHNHYIFHKHRVKSGIDDILHMNM